MVDYINDPLKVKNQLGKPDERGLQTLKKSEIYLFEEGPLKLSIKTIDDTAIWGNFNWGEKNWGYDYGNLFIIGDTIRGVIGTSTLGDEKGEEIVKFVGNENNNHRQYFFNDVYVDTTLTTANINLTDNQIEFVGTQELVSETIAKDIITNTPILTATLEVTSDLNSALDTYLSNDGGNTWESATIGVLHFFAAAGYDLKYKIDNSIPSANPFPTQFGTWGKNTTENVTITQLNVRYN